MELTTTEEDDSSLPGFAVIETRHTQNHGAFLPLWPRQRLRFKAMTSLKPRTLFYSDPYGLDVMQCAEMGMW